MKPQQYHRVADEMSEQSLKQFLAGLKQQVDNHIAKLSAHEVFLTCLLYTSPSPRDLSTSRMPSSA